MKFNGFRVGPLVGCLTAAAIGPNAIGQEMALAPTAGKSPPDLTGMTLEELTNVEVTTAGRKQEKLSEVAAAVHVITQEDIRRSGATSIAEALRMAPGLDVARIDSSRWAISSRGFNDFFANKLLVLMDGRSVYTPLFSGVFWDVQDTVLEDIDRIEVVRGPGAAMWGANAVNGVINIITKHSKDTQGGLVTAGAGTEERGFGGVRYGGTIKEGLTYRAYVKYFNRDEFKNFTGGDAFDSWDMARGGFRTDWQISDNNSLRVQGDAYTGTSGQELSLIPTRNPFPLPPIPFQFISGRAKVAGGNVLSSFSHTFSETSQMTLQTYYDRTERIDQIHSEFRDTYDVDFQHRFAAGERQDFIWGLGYRLTTDQLGDGRAGTRSLSFTDFDRHDQLFSGFLQDVITLHHDGDRPDLKFTVGSKLEHNDYTGFEFQPNARLIWDPNETHSLWAGVSRAVRTPSRFEHTIDALFALPPILPNGMPAFVGVLAGNPDYKSEELMAYEAGYRVKASSKVSFDFTAFINDYRNLRLFDFAGLAPGGLPRYVARNYVKAETYGGEIGANWTVTDSWRLFAGYTLLEMQLHSNSPMALGPEAAEGESPQHQFQIRSFLNLPYNLQLDVAAYFVDELQARAVPSYTKLDVRLGWSPKKNFDLSIVGQNLLEDRHREFGPGFLVTPTEIERSVYAKATWRF